MKILLLPLQRGFIFLQILIRRRYRIVGGSERSLIATNGRRIYYTIAIEKFGLIKRYNFILHLSFQNFSILIYHVCLVGQKTDATSSEITEAIRRNIK